MNENNEKLRHAEEIRRLQIDNDITSSLLDNASAYVVTLEDRIDKDKSRMEAMKEALRACQQCMNDVLEQVREHPAMAGGYAGREAFKSLKNDALRLVNRVLDDGEGISELEAQYLQWKDVWTASFIEVRSERDLLRMQEEAALAELARTSIELAELRKLTTSLVCELEPPTRTGEL